MLILVTKGAVFANEVQVIGAVLVFNNAVTIKAVRRVFGDMFVMHQFAVFGFFQKLGAAVVACQTTVGNDISSIDFAMALYDLEMATFAGHAGFLDCLMGDRLDFGVFGAELPLQGPGRDGVTGIALRSALIEID